MTCFRAGMALRIASSPGAYVSMCSLIMFQSMVKRSFPIPSPDDVMISYFLFLMLIVVELTLLSSSSVSLYRGNEFAILRVFESQKSPFTTKIAG